MACRQAAIQNNLLGVDQPHMLMKFQFEVSHRYRVWFAKLAAKTVALLADAGYHDVEVGPAAQSLGLGILKGSETVIAVNHRQQMLNLRRTGVVSGEMFVGLLKVDLVVPTITILIDFQIFVDLLLEEQFLIVGI